jgi:ABC-type dipeptide/oligopeptide/nickel transport system ATPase component
MGIMGLHHGTKAEITGEILLDGENSGRGDPNLVRELRGSKMAMIFQDPLSSLHPYYTIGAQIIEGLPYPQRRGASRRPASTPSTCSAGSASRSRDPGRRLPAPVRRHAAAGHDRDGAQLRSGAAHRRRAHHGPRRHRRRRSST